MNDDVAVTPPVGPEGRAAPIRVLLADDQTLLRSTFRLMLDATPDLEVVGEAATGVEAVARARSDRADVVVMDIRMPEMDGIEATRRITSDDDLAGVRVLVLTTFETEDLVIQAITAGASGYLSKGVEPRAFLDAIRTVAAGDSLLSPLATTALIGRFLGRASGTRSPATSHEDIPPLSAGPALQALTPREREITALVGRGLSNIDIARRLFISPATTKTHVNRAMMKTDSRDRAQLVVFAYENGLVTPGGSA
ncbi:response regulator transcription factor [Xylanimonas ulmi]|uniref:LuxR family two component transcriptional regulator n=1 Tax=Xylanimonas ulmi TaxID=228973 RepID=A0A4Q7LZZ9_9MICO|nr:response regulator transcription factor [Xylanibacterium ulmi]RZS60027.1 LuxR family two component transcriptional regulator [Xylanibacterium ulmi]